MRSSPVSTATLLLVVAACVAPGAAPTSRPEGRPPIPSGDQRASDSRTPLGDAPPSASLMAEGGDPVVGRLGTYTWGDGGSDSPWLPGAPIAVGSGEPLSMALDPPLGITTWTARYVPSSADSPEGAIALGEGAGRPAFGAPGSGTWTVEVHVAFGDGLGEASYFWRLEVR